MLGTLLERPTIHKIFQPKYQVLLNMCNAELDIVKTIFDQQLAHKKVGKAIINKNMPRVSGLLRWSQELHDRIELTIGKLHSLHCM